MCTTLGMPSNRHSSTAGASRSSRSRRSRRGSSAVDRIDVRADLLAVAANVQRRPTGNGARTQQEACDGLGRGRARRVAPDQAHRALVAVELVADAAVQRLQVIAVERRDGPDRQHALHQRVRPVAVEIEEADRLEREQRAVRHEMRERDALEQPHAREPGPHDLRQDPAQRLCLDLGEVDADRVGRRVEDERVVEIRRAVVMRSQLAVSRRGAGRGRRRRRRFRGSWSALAAAIAWPRSRRRGDARIALQLGVGVLQELARGSRCARRPGRRTRPAAAL